MVGVGATGPCGGLSAGWVPVQPHLLLLSL